MGERFLGYGLVTGRNINKSLLIKNYNKIVKSQLINEDLDHERWKYRRAIFNPGFHRQ